MSLESLLSEDYVVVMLPTESKDASGGPTYTPYAPDPSFPATCPARTESSSVMLVSPFGDPLQVRKWLVITEQAGITSQHYLQTSDGIMLRVLGVNQNNAFGGIEEFYEIDCQEIKRP
jgi:hypothetical protein